MSSAAIRSSPEGDWLSPRTETQGLERYLNTLRDRWWVIVLAVVVSTGAAVAYLAVTPKSYQAHADLLVSPVPQGDTTTQGLGLIQASSDPTQDVSTASRLVSTSSVARRVIHDLGLHETPAQLLRTVEAVPVAQSTVVTVTATESSPRLAAAIANSFAADTIADRTAQLQQQLAITVPILRQHIAALGPTERQAAGILSGRLASLQALQGVADPTLSQTVRADVPTGPSAPSSHLTLAAGILAGLILGLGGAFAVQAIDPRVRREEQLRSLYRLPILARVPLEPRTRKAGALAPDRVSGQGVEAYRTLRASLAASHSAEFRSRSVMVTGSSPGEGKSTTAINLAYSLAQAGNRVILIEADMHRPAIGAALGCRPRHGIASVLIRQSTMEEALVSTEEYGPDLQLLLVERPGLESADRLSLPTARTLISEAESLADFVVVDAPPLTEVIDALLLAQEVGDVVIVTRLGRSKLRKLVDLGEILQQQGIQPAGVTLIGVDRSRDGGYYYAASREAADASRESVDA